MKHIINLINIIEYLIDSRKITIRKNHLKILNRIILVRGFIERGYIFKMRVRNEGILFLR